MKKVVQPVFGEFSIAAALRMAMAPKRILPIALVSCLTIAVHAVPFSPGDVFAGSSGGIIRHYSPAGVLLETLATGSGSEQTGMAFDSAGILYATAFQASSMSRFSTSGGAPLTPNPWLFNDSGSHNESIVFNAAGQFYVGQADGTQDIIKRAADGTFLARYDVATPGRGTDWIDLAADQKTMYYAGEGRIISRYDVSTGTQLADFATLPGSGNAYALRLLAGGGLLVADASNVKRLDASGAVVQTYDTGSENSFFALNLDPDGLTFWTAGISTGNIFRFDIATGTLISSITTGLGEVSGLAIFGEIVQGNPQPQGVPDGGSTGILAVLGVLALSVGRRYLKQETA